MKAKTSITRGDLRELELYLRKSNQRDRVNRILLAYAPPLVAIVLALVLLALFAPSSIRAPRILVPLFAALPGYLLLLRFVEGRRAAEAVNRSLENGNARALLGEQELTIEDDGLHVCHGGQETLHPWREVIRVVSEGGHCFIFVKSGKVVIIPDSSFEDADQFRLFAKMAVISHWNSQRKAPEPVIVRPAATTEPPALISMRPVSADFSFAAQKPV